MGVAGWRITVACFESGQHKSSAIGIYGESREIVLPLGFIVRTFACHELDETLSYFRFRQASWCVHYSKDIYYTQQGRKEEQMDACTYCSVLKISSTSSNRTFIVVSADFPQGASLFVDTFLRLLGSSTR